MKVKTFQINTTFDMAFKDNEYPDTKEKIEELENALKEGYMEEFRALPNVDNPQVKVKLVDKKEETKNAARKRTTRTKQNKCSY